MTNDVQDIGAVLLTGKGTAPEIFAEGAAQVLLGYPVTKLVLHALQEPATETSKEVRKTVAVLSMPTVTLIETAQMILKLCKEGEPQLVKFEAEQAARIKQLLVDVHLPEPPKASKTEPAKR